MICLRGRRREFTVYTVIIFTGHPPRQRPEYLDNHIKDRY